MAEYKNSIKFGLSFDNAKDVDGKLKTLIKSLNNTKIDLDINIKDSDVAKQLETLTKLADNFKKSLGGNVSLGDVQRAIGQIGTEAEKLSGELLKVSRVDLGNGLYKQTEQVATGIGEITKQSGLVQKIGDEFTYVGNTLKNVTDNSDKFNKSMADIQKAVSSLDSMKLNGLVNIKDVDKLKTELNTIYEESNKLNGAKFSDNQLKDYLNQVKLLETEEKNFQQTQNQLTNDINKAMTQVDKMKTSFGSKLPNGFAESTTSELNKLLEELKSVDGVNLNNLRNNFNTIKSSIETTNSETKQLANSLKETGSSGFFGNMSNFLNRVGMYYGSYQIIYEITDQLKKASEYTLAIDKNITDIMIISGRTREDVVKVTNSFKELGEQLHTTNQDMLSSASEMMRAGYSDEDSKKMIEQAVIGAKISGQTTEDVSQELITMKNAFNMSADSMSHVIDIFSKLDNTSATSFKEIAEAVSRTAFSAQEAKVPLDTLASYITVVSEKTRREASTIGDQFRTMFSRYQNIKLGNIDEDGKSINDVERAMNRIGLSIRTSKGEFKDFNTALQEFIDKAKSGDISQVDKLAVINALGGVRQKEALEALIENVDTLQKHEGDLANATGSAKKAFDEAYSQSLDAKVQDLKRSFEQLYEKIMSSDSLKWLITEATQLVTALSNVDGTTIKYVATIGILIEAMTKLSALNKTLIAGEAVSGIGKFIAVLSGMKSVKTDIDSVTNATKALQIAQVGVVAETEGLTGLSGAWALVTGGIEKAIASSMAFIATPLGATVTAIGIALGFAIGGFMSYEKHQADLAKQTKDLKKAIDDLNQSLSSGDTKGASAELDKIKDAQTKLQQYIELRNKAQQADSSSFNPTASGASQTTQVESFNRAIQEQIKVLKDAGLTVDETTGKVKEFEETESLIKSADVANKIKEDTKAQVENRMNLEQARKEYDDFISTTQDLYNQYQNLSAQESLSAEQKQQLSSVCEQLQSKFTDLNISVDKNGKAHIENSQLVSDNIQYLSSEGMTVETLTSIRLSDSKACSEWSIGNQQMTYQEVSNNINNYKTEIDAISKLMEARKQATMSYSSSAEAVGGISGNSTIDAVLNATKGTMENELNQYESAKKKIDDIYGSIKAPISNGGTPDSDYMPSGGGDSKKAQEEAVKTEKSMIDQITDAYNQAKDKISNDIEEIDAKITTLGDADDSNFTQRVDLTSQKIDKQKEIVEKAQEQLNALKSVTVNTAEAQETLENATLKASKELRDETLAVTKLQEEIEKADIDELKKMYEDQKEIELDTLDAQQQKQNKDLEDIKTKQEELHQTKMDNYDAELNALEKQHDEEEKTNELQEKANDLKEKELELDNLKNQKTIKVAKQQADGSFAYVGEVDTQAINTKQKEVDEAQKSYDKEVSDQQYEKEKQAIEDLKTAEDKAYDNKKKYLDKYSEDLKEAQDRDKKRIETYYSDIDKLAKDTLKQLEEEHSKNWNSIADSISSSVTRVTKQLQDLRDLQANFTASEVVDAINSNDVSGYLSNNKDRMGSKANVDENDINNHLKSIGINAKSANDSIDSLTDSYQELLSIKNDTDITDTDVEERKILVTRITKIDEDGNSTKLKNLKETNSKLETEQDSHYVKELNRQNKAQIDEYDSLVAFANKFTVFEDKFLELVQMVWDFRFGNIVNITDSAMGYVMEALVQCEEAFQDFRDMMSKMGVNISDVDISDNLAKFNAYKQEVSNWTEGKKSLYDNSNNPLYNKDVYNQYKAYANASGYSANSNILGSLSGSGVSTVNNKTSSNSNVFSFNNVTINADNPKEFWSQVLTEAKQTGYLKSTD